MHQDLSGRVPHSKLLKTTKKTKVLESMQTELMHYWWECKVIQTWKTIWRLLRQLKI